LWEKKLGGTASNVASKKLRLQKKGDRGVGRATKKQRGREAPIYGT